ncbi:MAG: sodium/glutamate symporter [Bacilli bacterium]|jgi:ESS family glutamate:Na+ symporter|nr:sodium/glutamate symporter [Bacilli bacterium]
MNVLNLSLAETVGLSIVVIFVGKLLVSKIGFLRKFLIPYPIVGGLVFAIITLIGYETNTFTIELDTTLQQYFMVCFFTTIGFQASIKVLKAGGIGVVIFLIISILLVICEDGVGVGLAHLLHQNDLLGLATGSIPMVGGHGTAAAFGPLLEKLGLHSASEVSIAAATFGLIAGSLIGGPIARKLILKHDLKSNDSDDTKHEEEKKTLLNTNNISLAFFQIALAVGIGFYVSCGINKLGITIPIYIGSMLVAAVMRNIFKDGSKLEMKIEEISVLGDMFLAIFLAQALMGLKLWQLSNLALPLIILLVVQVIIVALFAYFIVYKFMGKNYDASVLAAGICGFGLGATPNAIANMNAITSKFGNSIKAYFILPLVGCLFIDFCNAGIITIFLQFIN